MFCEMEMIEVEISRLHREGLAKVEKKIRDQQLGLCWIGLETETNEEIFEFAIAA
jgi:hypothetical protein